MKLICEVMLMFLFAGNARSASLTFTNSASADSFVRAAAPSSNYGGAGALSVSGPSAMNGQGVANGAFDSFIRFDTAALKATFNDALGSNQWTTTDVRLRLTELGSPANTMFNRGKGAFGVYWIADDSWIEGSGNPNAPTTSGITYNDKAAILNGETANLGIFTNLATDGTVSLILKLQRAITDEIEAGTEVGLYLTAVDANVGFTVDSRTFGTLSARPFLEVTATRRPSIISIAFSEGEVVLKGINGVSGAPYQVLSSLSLAAPLKNWQSMASNVFSGDGSFEERLTKDPGEAGRFYLLRND